MQDFEVLLGGHRNTLVRLLLRMEQVRTSLSIDMLQTTQIPCSTSDQTLTASGGNASGIIPFPGSPDD